MKKVIALLLAVIMVFTLVGCGGSNGPEASEPPATGNKPADTGKDTPDSEAAPDANEVADNLYSDLIGTPEEEIDHFARDPYKTVLISYEFNNSLCASIKTALTELAPAYNLELDSTAVVDADGVMNALETYSLMDYDCYIVILQDEFVPRMLSLVEELGLEDKWIAALNPCAPNGYLVHPGVSQSAEKHGVMVVDWVFDNYKEKLGDIDMSKVGHIVCSYSKIADFMHRDEAIYSQLASKGVKEEDIFYADTAVTGFSSQAAIDMVSATLSAHANEYDYFFIYGTCDDFGLGAGIAVTTMGIEDKTMVACIQADQVIAKWETGDKTGVDGAIYMSNYMYALPMVTGVIAMADGRATWDTLWANLREEGDEASAYGVSGEYVTFDDYKDVIAEINAYVASLGVDVGSSG